MTSPLGTTAALDPLNDILLPAQDLAHKIAHRESRRGGETLLASAVLLLMAERAAYRLLLQTCEQRRQHADAYAASLKDELTPEARLRIGNIHRSHTKPTSKRVASLPTSDG